MELNRERYFEVKIFVWVNIQIIVDFREFILIIFKFIEGKENIKEKDISRYRSSSRTRSWFAEIKSQVLAEWPPLGGWFASKSDNKVKSYIKWFL